MDTHLGNNIGHINKLVIENEEDTKTGHGRYFLAEKAAAEEDEL